MITEDYVSFETAKLLKEKGFDKAVLITDWWYDAEGQMHVRGNYSYSGAPVYDKETCFNCPTLQMAMKWLREAHNIHISIATVCNGKAWGYETIIQKQRIPVPATLFIDWKDTSEEACEAAIKYCLENLI